MKYPFNPVNLDCLFVFQNILNSEFLVDCTLDCTLAIRQISFENEIAKED